jgi:hypothetical protein
MLASKVLTKRIKPLFDNVSNGFFNFKLKRQSEVKSAIYAKDFSILITSNFLEKKIRRVEEIETYLKNNN